MRIVIAILLYTIVVGVLVWTRPAFLVAPDGQWKVTAFDTNDHTSMIGPAVVFPVLAVVCFYLASLIGLVIPRGLKGGGVPA